MLDSKRILELFDALNDELQAIGVCGEIGICGGAVMCLVFQARKATKDIDAIFEPTAVIRKAVVEISKEFDLPEDWLNDAAKTFFHAEAPKKTVWEGSHLNVWAPSADYMLAMKCVSARFDSFDRDDVISLIKHLNLKSPEEVFKIISDYYPKNQVPAKTRFLVEELLL